LTNTGNVARLVIREWYHLPLDSLKANIGQWFRDTESLPRYRDGRRFLPLWRLAESTGRYDETAKRYLRPGAPGGRHPHGIADTLRDAALRATPVPPAVLAHLIQRIAADHRVDDPRSVLLRLILVRSRTHQEAVMPGLDPHDTNAPYVLGRLFAVYEALQLQAAKTGGGSAPNSSFADKNFAGAISSPRLVLSAGARQSSAWLGKLRRSERDFFFRRDIDEIVDLLGPSTLGPVRAGLEVEALPPQDPEPAWGFRPAWTRGEVTFRPVGERSGPARVVPLHSPQRFASQRSVCPRLWEVEASVRLATLMGGASSAGPRRRGFAESGHPIAPSPDDAAADQSKPVARLLHQQDVLTDAEVPR